MIGLTTPTGMRGHCNRLSNVSKVEGLPLAIPLSMLGCSGGPIPTEASHRVNPPQNQRRPFRSRPVQHSATRSLAIATAGTERSTAPGGLPAANAATLSAATHSGYIAAAIAPWLPNRGQFTSTRPLNLCVRTATPAGYGTSTVLGSVARDGGIVVCPAPERPPLGVADRGRGRSV
jgi:hypothetical protein